MRRLRLVPWHINGFGGCPGLREATAWSLRCMPAGLGRSEAKEHPTETQNDPKL